jgi:hypothetical protein
MAPKIICGFGRLRFGQAQRSGATTAFENGRQAAVAGGR